MISIIIPCFNVEEYLERCFASCLAQMYQDFELIFVNDGSTDSTLIKLNKLKALDIRVKVIDLNHNVGTFHARKKGYEASVGDYIFFLDPDDEIREDFLYQMFTEINLKSADMMFCGLEVRPQKIYRNKVSLPKDCIKEQILECCILKTNAIPKGNPGKLYKKSLVNKVYEDLSFVDVKFIYAEDVVFFFSALINANKIASVNKEMYVYYLNPSSITTTKNLDKINNNIYQINLAIGFIKEIADKRNHFIKSASFVLIKSLKYDEKNLERMKCIINDDNVGYLRLTLKMISMNYKFRNVIRLFVFLCSFGGVKLK